MLQRVIKKYRDDGYSGIAYSALNGLRKFKIQMISQLLRLKSSHTNEITYNGIRLSTRAPIVRKNLSRFVNEKYEHQEAELIEKHIYSYRSVLELGGGIGYISAFTESRLNPSRTVEVIEANPELVPLIRETATLNGAQVTVSHAAYTPSNENVELSLSGDFVASTTVKKSRPEIETITVPGISLTKLLRNDPRTPVSLIIDIEGAEYELLESPSERRSMVKHCPLVIIELHDFSGSPNKAISKFHEDGYNLVDQRNNVYVFKNVGFK